MRDDAVMLGQAPVAPSELAGSWTVDPALLAALGLAALAYGRGRVRLSRRIPSRRGRGRAVAFYGGLVVVAAALMSPLDALSSALFSAHMVQHLLLMVVAVPLLGLSRPAPALVAGLPTVARQAAHRGRGGDWRRAAHTMANPLVVWTVGTVVLWAWHMPSLYEAALTHDALHVVEHASFVGAAMLLWSVVLGSGSSRRAPRPLAALLLFTSALQSSALGAVLVFASTPLYPIHAAGAAVWDVSLLEDQQLAGALMWGPPAIVYVLVMGWLLVRWFAEMEDTTPEKLLIATGERA